MKILGIIPARDVDCSRFGKGLLGIMLLPFVLCAGCETQQPSGNSGLLARSHIEARGNEVTHIQGHPDRATELLEYDREVVAAIETRWQELLESKGVSIPQQGKVVVEFSLRYNGRVSELEVKETTLPEDCSKLCMSAITDAAPFRRWPAEVRRLAMHDKRKVRFTFYFKPLPEGSN